MPKVTSAGARPSTNGAPRIVKLKGTGSDTTKNSRRPAVNVVGHKLRLLSNKRSPSVVSITDSEPDDGAKPELLGSDTEYPEPRKPATIKSLKRAAPSTPPIRTRTAVKKEEEFVTESEGETPIYRSKRTKLAEVEEDSGGDRTPPASILLPSKFKTPVKSSILALIDEAIETGTIDRISDSSSDDGVTFGASAEVDNEPGDLIASPALVMETAKLSKVQSGHGDDVLCVKSYLKNCEVHRADNEDEYIRDNGGYNCLFKLKSYNAAPIKAYLGVEGHGLVVFSRWAELAPTMKVKSALKTIIFQRDHTYVNLSRIDPKALFARPSMSYNHFDLCVDIAGSLEVATCVSPVAVVDSNLITPSSGLQAYATSGLLHIGEFERLVSVLGMVTNSGTDVTMRLYKDALSFTNKTYDSHRPRDKAEDILSQLADSSHSPSKKGKGKVLGYGNKWSPFDKIPMYDGRRLNRLSMTAAFFDAMDTLPLYAKEIPAGSFAVVGYATYLVKGPGQKVTFFPLPRWVLVLADN